jgi:hypothetical protein
MAMMKERSFVALAFALTGCAGSARDPAAPPKEPAHLGEEDRLGAKRAVANGTRMVMTMRAVKLEGGGESPFQIDDRLKNGERIAYYVTADRPAYVYVMQFFADGGRHVLFPDKGEQRLAGGVETRVPPPGGYFRLTGDVGTEHVYVIASQTALHSAAPELARVIADVLTSPAASAPSGDATAPPLLSPPAASTTPVTTAAASALGPAATDRPKPPPRLPKPPKSNYLALLNSRSLELGTSCAEDGLQCRALELVSGSSYQGSADDAGVLVIHFPFQHVR